MREGVATSVGDGLIGPGAEVEAESSAGNGDFTSLGGSPSVRVRRTLFLCNGYSFIVSLARLGLCDRGDGGNLSLDGLQEEQKETGRKVGCQRAAAAMDLNLRAD